MLVSGVFVHRYLTMLAVPNQSGCRSGDPVPVKAEDVYTLFVWFPRDLILVLGKVKNATQYKWERPGKRIHVRSHEIAAMNDSEVATAPKTPPCILIISKAAR